MIYGRARNKFIKLFPAAKFEGYECNIRFGWYTLKEPISKIKKLCKIEKIDIIEIK